MQGAIAEEPDMSQTCTRAAVYLVTLLLPIAAAAQTPNDRERIGAIERQLGATQAELARLKSTIDELRVELGGLRESSGGDASAAPDESASPPSDVAGALDSEDYTERMLTPDLGGDERERRLEARPELFVQSRYQAEPIDEATADDVTRNFTLSRMEARWAGRVADKVGLGFEIQYHPAPAGAPEELVNDAFAEYYVNDAVTVRGGQFVKPFGFDIQQSSSERESPERGIFAGYFFPGQRDRGFMVTADLARVAPWLDGTTLYGGVFNGNRFFDDNNNELNYNVRVRKVFDALPLAIGVSAQRGTQLLPPAVAGSGDENIYGVDVQYVLGRLGIHAEYVRGDMPATLLSLEPEFAPAFVAGAKSSGAAAFFNYNLTAKGDVYWRWDRFTNDPVTGRDIRAFNVGYLRAIGESSRIGIDYQTKNDVTFNDDELNTQLAITWNMAY
jgi:hypothetical protein